MEHCTWDGSRNPLVRHRHEHHRPDRVFVPPNVRGIEIERVRGHEHEVDGKVVLQPYSDHYGLAGQLKLLSELHQSEEQGQE